MTKLIAVDMDGTFLRDDKSYDKEKFAEIYQELEKRNIKFTVASGNQYYQIISLRIFLMWFTLQKMEL